MAHLSSTLRCFKNFFGSFYVFVFLSCSMGANILIMISRRRGRISFNKQDETTRSCFPRFADSNETTRSGSPWDRLPEDMLEMIFGRLWTGDRVRLRLVCKSWNRILIQSCIPTAPEAPWEILSGDSYKNPQSYLTQLCFRSLSEGRTYRFNLPTLCGLDNNRGWLCAQSRGWLVLAVGHNLNPDVILWNPLSGAIRKLPPLSTLPFFNDFEYTGLGMKIQNFTSVINRVEVFSVGSIDCVVAAIFRTCRGNRIALCTPREVKWTPFNLEQEDEEEERRIHFVDILFHTFEGKLKVAIEKLSTRRIGAQNFKSKKFEVTLMDCQVQVVPLLVGRYRPDPMDAARLPSGRIVWRLVESSITHRVLYLGAILELFRAKNRVEGLIPDFYWETIELLVHHLDVKREAVFIGATGSFSLPVVHGIVPGCVYFAIDDANGCFEQGCRKPYDVRESGQYFLTQETNRMRRNPSRTIRFPSGSKIGWFMPQLFIR